MSRWIETFAAACVRASADVEWVADRLDEVEQAWRAQLGMVRAGSALDRLLRRLPGTPVVTVDSAAELTGSSFQRANVAIARLVEAGVLQQRGGVWRNRVFEATAVLDALTDVERKLASATGDTHGSPPGATRSVPPLRPRRIRLFGADFSLRKEHNHAVSRAEGAAGGSYRQAVSAVAWGRATLPLNGVRDTRGSGP